MEPSQNLPAGDAPESAVAPAGELVVQNGRQCGVRRALTVPITLIGRAPGCDVRLNAKGVHLLHCALVQGPAGLMLRNLQPQGATLVNGETINSCLLQEGDLLSVGPFHFRVRLPRINGAHDVELLWREKEALRVQAAAVAAQQAALMEEENRLEQRRGSLQKQEQQLATHLEERRRHLVELQEQIREARAGLRKERAAHVEQTLEIERKLERTHRENQTTSQRLQLKRQRLVKLHRGLRRRSEKHWSSREADVQKRELALAQRQHELEMRAERQQRQREALVEERLRFNGAAELGRRQLQDARQQLAAERRDWQLLLAREQAEWSERCQLLDQRAADLDRIEHELNRRVKQWQDARFGLERELEGLQSRIRNQRRLLLDQQSEMARLSAVVVDLRSRDGQSSPQLPALPAPSATYLPVPIVMAAELAPEEQRRLAVLEEMAAELADQRLHLTEQFERLLLAQQHWQDDRDQAAQELEEAGLRLLEHERSLDARERALEPAENALQHRREEAVQARCHLEAWRARLGAREAAWEGEREKLLADVAARERLAGEQQAVLAEMRQRWLKRRQQELEQLRTQQGRCREAFQHYTGLWAEAFRRNSRLEQEQRALAERALALEQYRLEMVGQADNSPAAERRLERLRRRWVSLAAAGERRLARDRQRLENQLTFLEQRFDQLEELAEDVTERQVDFSDQRTEHDQELASEHDAAARMEQALHSLRAQREVYQRQLQRLQDEVERMALTLIEESDKEAPPLAA